MPSTRHLAMLETSGNQAYVFASNRQRESVGASELTVKAGTTWVDDALADQADIELIVQGSGKAIVACREPQRLRELIATVTRRACFEAPGLNVTGAIHPDPSQAGIAWDDAASLEAALAQLHRVHADARDALGDPAAHLLQLPPVQICATSGFPAALLDVHDPGAEAKTGTPTSVVSAAKRKRRVIDDAHRRMQAALTDAGGTIRLTRREKELSETVQGGWLGVLHADGNGVGQIFVNFAELSGATSADELATLLLAFSRGLDIATKRALARAVDSVWKDDDEADVLPLVLGGDDVTVLCEGSRAVDLAVEFVSQFEQSTSEPIDELGEHRNLLTRIAQEAFGEPKLGACAGVAIVKPHFPFSIAYGLAEQLTASAKQVKTQVTRDGRPLPCGAVDFHVLYDSTAASLDEIRARHVTPGGHATARPFVVTVPNGPEPASAAWVFAHDWKTIDSQAQALQTGKPSRTFVHALRDVLALGPAAADARLALLRAKHEPESVDALLHEGSLFVPDGSGAQLARLLDAMELAEIRRAREARS